jgi:predicted DNA-binding protein YlxM (UPF0122 family)
MQKDTKWFNDLFEEFGMQLMPPIDESTPAKFRIAEVEEHREISKMNIENLIEINKESLEEYMLKLVRLITMTQNFVKRTTQELKQEVSTKVCDGELDIEKMQVREIKEDHGKLFTLEGISGPDADAEELMMILIFITAPHVSSSLFCNPNKDRNVKRHFL